MKKQNANVVAVVGPKGGVGKTTISVNLAIALAGLGKRVVIVDLDLGASNIHTYLGIKNSIFSLDDFILKKVNNISDIVVSTDIENMNFICGGDIPGIANLHYQKKMKMIRNLGNLKSDFVLLDLGAGVSFNVIDFVIFARQMLLVTTPEVPSLYNLYSFIKSLLFRQLTMKFKQLKNFNILELLEKAKDAEANPTLNTMKSVITEAERIDKKSVEYIEELLNSINPIVVVNRVRSEKDANTGAVIQNLMNIYLSINSSLLVSVHEDASVGYALTKSRPVMLEAPHSTFAVDINKIAKILCKE